MNPQIAEVVGKHFEVADTLGIKVATCRRCRKQVVLRDGSQAYTRLLSHVINAHGSLDVQMPLPAVKK